MPPPKPRCGRKAWNEGCRGGARRLAVRRPVACADAAAGFRLEGTPRQGALLRGVAPPGTVSLMLDGRDVPLAADGRFLLGFDRDAGPAARLTARLGDGREVMQMLSVAARAWRIQNINMARPSTGRRPNMRACARASWSGSAPRAAPDRRAWAGRSA